ncbi:jg14211 [Pararge aegeria aegeria]|uniref:Jg14211 protein n=1 Tax=Pararge aegeria aegeria TaxID=348720 RepID=A0A8S4REU0_9NEOP|nr:jg14211 [Pararge aegeria aegeria]
MSQIRKSALFEDFSVQALRDFGRDVTKFPERCPSELDPAVHLCLQFREIYVSSFIITRILFGYNAWPVDKAVGEDTLLLFPQEEKYFLP